MGPPPAGEPGSGRSSAAAGSSSAACPPLYFCVLYDDNRTALFNITCQKEHLVEAIRRSCRLDRNTVIELCTLDGRLLKLAEMEDHESLVEQLESRDVVVLCKLEASKHPSIEPRLVPLIAQPESIPELKELADTIDQRVTEREGRLTQKQLAEVKRLQQQQQQQQQMHHRDRQSTGGHGNSRYANKNVVLYNKVKPRPSETA